MGLLSIILQDQKEKSKKKADEKKKDKKSDDEEEKESDSDKGATFSLYIVSLVLVRSGAPP